MNSKTNKFIYITDEYDLFKLAKWNRKINYSKISQLEKSIGKYGYIGSPIVVNEKKEIIDGQHRFFACKNLNEPIQYIIIDGLDVESAITLNAYQSQWKLDDYVNSYIEQGNKNYIYLQKLMNEYRATSSTVICACTEASVIRGNGQMIKDGLLKIDDADYENSRKVLEYINRFKPFSVFFGGDIRTTNGCLIRLYKAKLIDEDRMVEQFEKYGETFIPRGKTLDCVRSLNEIYNIGKKKKEYFVDTYRSIFSE